MHGMHGHAERTTLLHMYRSMDCGGLKQMLTTMKQHCFFSDEDIYSGAELTS